jgi:epoxyqueuosine reductase QueG
MGLEEEIKKAAKEEGADLVGFAPVNALSNKLQIEWAESAVVIGVAVGGVDRVPDDIAYRIAIYLQGLGLKAEVIASSESRYDIRPLAVEASLGSRGKNGLVITPEFGPRVRFSGVITNAIVNSHKKRIRDFCNGCNLCVERCPVNAIGVRFDIKRCEGHKNCMICAEVCPVPK